MIEFVRERICEVEGYDDGLDECKACGAFVDNLEASHERIRKAVEHGNY